MGIEALAPRQIETALDATARLNIWHGPVRSGKTVASQIAWLRHLRRGPKGPLLMIGKTSRTLKRNILDPLEEFLGPSRMRTSIGNGEAEILGRRVYLAGANDERAESKIRGLTLAGAYGDELTTWPQSFFRMLLSRLSIAGAAFFGTTNPDAPAHWVKREFIDRAGVLNMRVFGFHLDDNTYLDPGYIADLKKEYVGLWKKRFIDGLWVVAEGAIYDMLDESAHFVPRVPKGVTIERCWVGVDYGTSNPFVAILFGEGSDGVVYALDSWRWDARKTGKQMTDAAYRVAVETWLAKATPEGVEVEAVWVDPSAASFVAECADGWLPAMTAENAVIEGIRYVSKELDGLRLKIVAPRCPVLVETLPGYAWNPKAQEKGEDEPLKVDDHDADALRYGVYSDACQRIDPEQTGWVS